MPKDEICFPNYHENMALANDTARYFHPKILNIRNYLDSIDVTQNRYGDLIDDPVFSSNLETDREGCILSSIMESKSLNASS